MLKPDEAQKDKLNITLRNIASKLSFIFAANKTNRSYLEAVLHGFLTTPFHKEMSIYFAVVEIIYIKAKRRTSIMAHKRIVTYNLVSDRILKLILTQ